LLDRSIVRPNKMAVFHEACKAGPALAYLFLSAPLFLVLFATAQRGGVGINDDDDDGDDAWRPRRHQHQPALLLRADGALLPVNSVTLSHGRDRAALPLATILDQRRRHAGEKASRRRHHRGQKTTRVTTSATMLTTTETTLNSSSSGGNSWPSYLALSPDDDALSFTVDVSSVACGCSAAVRAIYGGSSGGGGGGGSIVAGVAPPPLTFAPAAYSLFDGSRYVARFGAAAHYGSDSRKPQTQRLVQQQQQQQQQPMPPPQGAPLPPPLPYTYGPGRSFSIDSTEPFRVFVRFARPPRSLTPHDDAGASAVGGGGALDIEVRQRKKVVRVSHGVRLLGLGDSGTMGGVEEGTGVSKKEAILRGSATNRSSSSSSSSAAVMDPQGAPSSWTVQLFELSTHLHTRVDTDRLPAERAACAAAAGTSAAAGAPTRRQLLSETTTTTTSTTKAAIETTGQERMMMRQQQQQRRRRRLGCHWANWKHQMVCGEGQAPPPKKKKKNGEQEEPPQKTGEAVVATIDKHEEEKPPAGEQERRGAPAALPDDGASDKRTARNKEANVDALRERGKQSEKGAAEPAAESARKEEKEEEAKKRAAEVARKEEENEAAAAAESTVRRAEREAKEVALAAAMAMKKQDGEITAAKVKQEQQKRAVVASTTNATAEIVSVEWTDAGRDEVGAPDPSPPEITPPPPPPPPPSPSSSNFCCFAGGCGGCERVAESTNFCAESKQMCVDHCGGDWCDKTGKGKGSPTAQTDRGGGSSTSGSRGGRGERAVKMCENPRNARALFRDFAVA
jgi:hypothetical protein